MPDRFRCSVASRDREEPLFATASQVQRWVLLEEPGGWGHDALLQSRIPREVALALRARARSEGTRLLLIRRHGRVEAPQQRTVLFASTTADVQRVQRYVVDHAADLLDLDWSILAGGPAVGGERITDPVYLVCTNGRHDTCCAEFGRPVAQALAASLPGAVWEASHFGGDRFAGNVVCLPHGVYYGRITPLNATRIARDYRDGRLHLDNYRGRSCFPFAVQAAEHYGREHTGYTGLDDVAPVLWHELDDGVVRTELATPGGRLIVTVQRWLDDAVRLTCDARAALQPLRFQLVNVEGAA